MEIAAFHLGALGDLIVTIPALHLTRRRAGPRSRLCLFASGAARGDLLRSGGAAHEAIDLARSDLSPLFAEDGVPPGWFLARAAGFGEVYVFLRHASVLVANLRRLGVSRVLEIEPRPPDGARTHVVDWLLNGVAKSTGHDNERESGRSRAPRLRVPLAEREAAATTLGALGIPIGHGLLIHPGSGGARKRWLLGRFVEIALRSRERGLVPFFVLGPVELDTPRAGASEIEACGVPILRDPKLLTLAAVAQAAGTYLGNDSGPTHLAAAVGARTIALFGPSDKTQWAPRGARVRVLEAENRELSFLKVSRVLDELSTS